MLILAIALLMFAGCSQSDSAAKSGFNVNVTVKDESGKLVAGVKVQACDDSVCKVADTDSNGFAGFSMSKNSVDIHILKVPDVFTFNAEETVKTDDEGNLTVILKAAEG